MRDEIAADSLSVQKYLLKEGGKNQLIWFYSEGKAISRFVERLVRCSCDHQGYFLFRDLLLTIFFRSKSN